MCLHFRTFYLKRHALFKEIKPIHFIVMIGYEVVIFFFRGTYFSSEILGGGVNTPLTHPVPTRQQVGRLSLVSLYWNVLNAKRRPECLTVRRNAECRTPRSAMPNVRNDEHMNA